MRPSCLVLAALLLAGCGEAAWNPDLKANAPLDRGTPFAEALAQHGCPDSIQEIDTETFTATWDQTRLVAAAPFYSKRDESSLSYLVRKGKVSGARPSPEARGSLRSSGSTTGVLPLVAAFAAWLVGRTLREKARSARLPLVLLSVLLLVPTLGSDRTGVAAAGGGAAEGSPVGTLVDELGAPSSVLRLPGEAGSLLVYRTEERKRAIVGGTESVATQAFLVQRGRVVARSAKATTLQAQFYVARFFTTPSSEPDRRFEVAWTVALGTLVLVFATRAPRKTSAAGGSAAAATLESAPPA